MATLDELKLMLQQIKAKIDESPRVGDPIAPTQVVTVTGMSDIDDNLGLMKAGEFRSGTGTPGNPGDPFSGVRFGYPAFKYGDTFWNIVGVNSDTLQFGLRASDGWAIFGGGNVTLYSGGMALVPGAANPNIIRWVDLETAGTYTASIGGYLTANTYGTLGLVARAPDSTKTAMVVINALNASDTEGDVRLVLQGDNNSGYFSSLNDTDNIVVFTQSLYTFNLQKADIDFKVWGLDPDTALFHIDAGTGTLYYKGTEIATA